MNTPATKLIEKDGKFVVSVTIPATEVEAALNAAAQALMPTVDIPGFRPGYVPIDVVRQHYSKIGRAHV